MFCAESLIRIFFILIFLADTAYAGVSTDGSVGAEVSLKGPEYDIRASLGQQKGSNLFHSFRDFDIGTGEKAIFSGPASVENIISRITGGKASQIDGLIKSEISGANLFFINPQGMVFGPNAALDISGSFYVSSSDFSDFPKDLSAEIAFNNCSLKVPDGKTLAVAADSVKMSGATFEAKNGNIFIVANRFFMYNSTLDADAIGAENGKEIAIRAGKIEGKEAVISADAMNFGKGGNITISGITDGQPSESVVFSGGSQIVAGSFHDGDAGTITVRAKNLTLSEGTYIGSESFAGGNGGNINLYVENLKAIEGSGISIESSGTGNGGNLLISGLGQDAFAKSVLFSGKYPGSSDTVTPDDNPEYFSRIYAVSKGFGNAGNVEIHADTVSFSDQAFIRSKTLGTGAGGNISVYSDTLTLSSGAAINSDTAGDGAGGHIHLESRIVEIKDGEISVDTAGNGDGGSLTITGLDGKIPAESVSLSDGARIFAGTLCNEDCQNAGDAGFVNIHSKILTISGAAYVGSESFGSGSGGNVRINVGQLRITEGSEISVKTDGSGMGGELSVSGINNNNFADNITITGNFQGYASRIFAGSDGTGQAGVIDIAAHKFSLSDNAILATSAQNADGGNIYLNIGSLFFLNHGEITTSVSGGQGNGGNIEICTNFAVLKNSKIIANAYNGNGGNIYIGADQFIATPSSRITASSKLGIDGNVEIDSPETDISNSLMMLPALFQDSVLFLRDPCAIRLESSSSLFIKGRGGLASEPEDFVK